MKINTKYFFYALLFNIGLFYAIDEEGFFDPKNESDLNLFNKSWDENTSTRNNFSSDWTDFWKNPEQNVFMQNIWENIEKIENEDFESFLIKN